LVWLHIYIMNPVWLHTSAPMCKSVKWYVSKQLNRVHLRRIYFLYATVCLYICNQVGFTLHHDTHFTPRRVFVFSTTAGSTLATKPTCCKTATLVSVRTGTGTPNVRDPRVFNPDPEKIWTPTFFNPTCLHYRIKLLTYVFKFYIHR